MDQKNRGATVRTWRSKPRILLDSNIWRYVVDADAVARLRRWSHGRVRILVAPGVVFEALRTRDGLLRARLVRALTEGCWLRMLPEAYLEAREFVEEARRVRPNWLRSQVDRHSEELLLVDWTRERGGFWERARVRLDETADWVAQAEGDMVDVARIDTQELRERMRAAHWSFDKLDLTDVVAELDGKYVRAGWRGEPVSAWRVFGHDAIGSLIHSDVPGNPHREWILPYVDLDELKRVGDVRGWNEFWLYDVEAVRMPKLWLRWAFSYTLALLRGSPGEPGDIQLATYLSDCDVFVSADKVLVRAANKVMDCSPVRIARSLLAPGGPDAVAWLRDLIESGRPAQNS